jgi:DNA-binding ferritin-like protein
MTKNEHKQVIDLINKIGEINLDGLLKSIYYGDSVINSKDIQGFTPNEMKIILSDSLLKITKELQVRWNILPIQLNDSSGSIAQHLQVILTQLINKAGFDKWVDSLIWLVQYQMQFGFWEDIDDKVKQANRGIEREARNSISVLHRTIDEAKGLKNILEGHLDDVRKLHELYQQERNELNKMMESADSAIKDLRQAELDAAANNGKASAILEETKNSIESNRKLVSETREKFASVTEEVKGVHKEYIDGIAEANKSIEAFEEILQSAREKEQHILSQEEDINRLRGYLADNTLADAFSKRSSDIEKAVGFWRISCFVASVFALFWILIIFNEYKSISNNTINWQMLILNVLRTTPAVVALYFCFSQYGKERNLQEEYAFKAAVSKTITPYSDMVKDVAEKTKILSSTVQGVYTPPQLGEPFKPFSFNSKDLVDISKNLLDSAKTIQEAGASILKAKISSDSKEEKSPSKE